MSTRLRHLPFALVLAALAIAAAGCNIFGFTSDKGETPLFKAEQAIRDGDYSAAKKELTDANGALIDSTDSMVLYTYSKAVLLESGLSIARIVDLIQGDKSKSASGNLALLDEIDKLPYVEQTAWYRANSEIAAKLQKIWNDPDKKISGLLTRDDITLDYSVSNIMGGILSLRDTNRDNTINDRDFKITVADVSKLISPGPGTTKESFGFSGITDSQGISYNGLTAFLGSPLGKAAKPAGVSGYSPDDINAFIATFFKFLDGGDASIDFFVKNLADKTSYDAEKIKEYIPMVAKIINYYWYDDGKDNDGDGRNDEEIIDGIDNDGDKLVDEDSHYMKDYDTTNTRNTLYIPVWEKWKNK